MKDKFYKTALFGTLGLGILLRLFFFLFGRPFWHDECSTVINIFEKSYLGLWDVLSNLQSAPPIYLMISKFINSVCPIAPEYALRLLPLLCGIASVIAFYYFTKQFFQNKYLILVSNVLFCINSQLIYYSQEFRPYSIDVLISILGALFLSNLCLEKLDKIHKILLSILFLVLPFISLPSVFVIGAWMGVNVYKNKGLIKDASLILMPTLIANIFFFLHTLLPTHRVLSQVFPDLDGFISFNVLSIIQLVRLNLNYFFTPCSLYIVSVILIFTGIYTFIKQKREIHIFIIFVLILAILASVLHLFPIRERNALYMLPYLIILLLVPIEYLKNKIIKILSTVLLIVYLIPYAVNFPHYFPTGFNEDARTLMQILVENYQDSDFIIYNDASASEFVIYSRLNNLKADTSKIGKINAQKSYDEYENVLASLPGNKTYWFYFPFDYSHTPVIQYLKMWKHINGKVLYEKQIKNSYLLLLKL